MYTVVLCRFHNRIEAELAAEEARVKADQEAADLKAQREKEGEYTYPKQSVAVNDRDAPR